jgi:type II secretory pathway pseudopilin PulG
MKIKVKTLRKKLHYLFFVRAFSLIETLVVVSIMGTLYSIVVPVINIAKNRAYESRTKQEFQALSTALELYKSDNGGQYPPDSNRNLPNGLEEYIAGYGENEWPKAPYPGSVYDWDNWTPGKLSDGNPPNPDAPVRANVYQISVRFCPIGKPEECQFPKEDWAEDFDVNSAMYYCLEGPCRSHSGQPYDHPGYCVNCETQNDEE